MIQRDDLYIDSDGRVVIVGNEACKHCQRPSRESHPAGVLSGAWKCHGCGRWQYEPITDHIEED